MEIIGRDEENGVVMAVLPNQMQAFAECAALGTMTKLYGRMPLHTFHERFTASAAHDRQILMFYQVGEDDSNPVPVGFFWLGWLNPAMEKYYEARNRELSPEECHSGNCLWVLENCAPLGHFDIMRKLLLKSQPSVSHVCGLVGGKRQQFKNKYCNLGE